jgi:DNA mismatch repair protein MSH4
MVVVRSFCDQLFVFVDCIALLDMLCSFSELVGTNQDAYCRPELTEAGPLVIQGGRHLILMSMEENSRSIFGNLISNDTFISPLDNFQILTGSNGSGYVNYLNVFSKIYKVFYWC